MKKCNKKIKGYYNGTPYLTQDFNKSVVNNPNLQFHGVTSNGAVNAGSVGQGEFPAAGYDKAIQGAGSLVQQALSGQDASVATAFNGALTGASAGMAFGPIGAAVGAGVGIIAGSMGHAGSVNEATGAVDNPSGIVGLFGHSKRYLQNKGARIKNGIQAKENAANISADFQNMYGNTLINVADGGVIPTTKAKLSKGELVKDSTGIHEVPGSHGLANGEDDVLATVEIGSQVLSNKLKVPGTNKTYAQMGKKLIKTNKKATDKYSQGTIDASNMIHSMLLNMQEQNKNMSSVNGYSGGTEGISPNINPYGYNKDMSKFKYWDSEANDYSKEYLDFVNNLTEQDVKDIYSGKYGDMSTYLGKNKGYIPTIDEARKLMTDKKYGDWHKISQAFVDGKINSTAGPRQLKLDPYRVGVNTPINRIDDSRMYDSKYFKYNAVPSKININRPLTNSKGVVPSLVNRNGNNILGDIMDYTIPAAAAIANISSAKSEPVDIYSYTPKFAPVEYNVSPQLRQIDRTNAIARYNQANINPNTGANMTFGLQSAIARNNAMADVYAQKYNIENKNIGRNIDIYNQWANSYANARHQAAIEQAQNDASARNVRRKGISDLSTILQSVRRDKRLTKRDSALLDYMAPYLRYGSPDSELQQMINTYRRW